MVVDGERTVLSEGYHTWPASVVVNDNGSVTIGRGSEKVWLDRHEWQRLLEVLQEEVNDGREADE